MEDWLSYLDMDGDKSLTFLNEYQKTNCGEHEHPNPTNLYCCANETQTRYSGYCSSKRGLGRPSEEGRKRETRDHIMSERKRRQQMAESFIALSAIIPGLKKIDKASVLSEAINYVKQLQGRIAVLEEECEKKSNSKSMIFIKKCQSHSASCESETDSNHVLLDEVKVEAIGLELEREVLVRILCEKRKGILLKLLTLLENLHLSILSSSVLPLGKNTINITIIAQMGEEYNMTGDELVKKLTQDLVKLYI